MGVVHGELLPPQEGACLGAVHGLGVRLRAACDVPRFDFSSVFAHNHHAGIRHGQDALLRVLCAAGLAQPLRHSLQHADLLHSTRLACGRAAPRHRGADQRICDVLRLHRCDVSRASRPQNLQCHHSAENVGRQHDACKELVPLRGLAAVPWACRIISFSQRVHVGWAWLAQGPLHSRARSVGHQCAGRGLTSQQTLLHRKRQPSIRRQQTGNTAFFSRNKELASAREVRQFVQEGVRQPHVLDFHGPLALGGALGVLAQEQAVNGAVVIHAHQHVFFLQHEQPTEGCQSLVVVGRIVLADALWLEASRSRCAVALQVVLPHGAHVCIPRVQPTVEARDDEARLTRGVRLQHQSLRHLVEPGQDGAGQALLVSQLCAPQRRVHKVKGRTSLACPALVHSCLPLRLALRERLAGRGRWADRCPVPDIQNEYALLVEQVHVLVRRVQPHPGPGQRRRAAVQVSLLLLLGALLPLLQVVS